MDCSSANYGCDGGVMQYAFDYVKDGIESERDYPYKAREGTCQFSRSKSVTTVSRYVDVRDSESSLLDAVGK